MIISDKLKEVIDSRSIFGRRYSLWSVLGLFVVARLCNCNSILASHRLGKRLNKKQLQQLGFWKKLPCYSTLTIILRGIDLENFESVLGSIIKFLQGKEASTHQAIDGKRLCGSSDGERPAVHLVSLFSIAIGGVTGQVESTYGAGEIAAALKLVANTDLTGIVITGDALFATPKLCDTICKQGGDFVLTVKKNQRELHEALETAFADPVFLNQAERFESHAEKGHGRIEQRCIAVIDSPLEYLERWNSVTQVSQVKRVRWLIKDKKETYETVYLISSFKTKVLPEKLLEYNRNHWGIENRLHRARDVIFGEDKSTLRKKSAPQASAAISNLAIAIAKKIHYSLTQAREIATHSFNVPIQLIGVNIK